MIKAKLAIAGLALGAVLAAGGALAQVANSAALPPGQSKITVVKTPYDTKALLAEIAAVPPDVYRGQTIWLQRCAYCHDGVGQPSYHVLGPWLGAETVQKLTEAGFRAYVLGGAAGMPGFRYTLKPEQMTDLIAFMKSVSSDQKPTAAQLAGGEIAAGGD